ncbi:hypothetical protein D9M71_749420 [compost metagenome]
MKDIGSSFGRAGILQKVFILIKLLYEFIGIHWRQVFTIPHAEGAMSQARSNDCIDSQHEQHHIIRKGRVVQRSCGVPLDLVSESFTDLGLLKRCLLCALPILKLSTRVAGGG